MATFIPPKKGVQFILYATLRSQANLNIFQVNPTIASGDFKVSIDGGALANLTTLPTVTPAASVMVKMTLSTSEMNGDNVTVICSDAAGAEWCDESFNIQTSARQIDDLAYPTTSGRSIDVATTGEVGLDFDNIKAASAPTTLTNITVPVVTTTTTATNLTNAPTAGDFTAVMKTSLNAATPAASLSSSERNAIADSLLDRNMALGVDSGTNSTAFRTPRQALRALRNKVNIAATVLTVTKEDDATLDWTGTVVSDSGAAPVTSVDPA